MGSSFDLGIQPTTTLRSTCHLRPRVDLQHCKRRMGQQLGSYGGFTCAKHWCFLLFTWNKPNQEIIMVIMILILNDMPLALYPVRLDTRHVAHLKSSHYTDQLSGRVLSFSSFSCRAGICSSKLGKHFATVISLMLVQHPSKVSCSPGWLQTYYSEG